jgi:leader peptidase (prepilin peptidase) / N-methyltransferase
MVVGRKNRKDPIPFGPFLALGAIIAVLAGEPILDWYLGA